MKEDQGRLKQQAKSINDIEKTLQDLVKKEVDDDDFDEFVEKQDWVRLSIVLEKIG